MNNHLKLFAITALAACGGGDEEFVELVVPVGALAPTSQSVFVAADEAGEKFPLIFSQISDQENPATLGQTSNMKTNVAEIFEDGTDANGDAIITLITSEGRRLTYEVDSKTQRGRFEQFEYLEQTDGTSLRIRRFDSGIRDGFFKLGDPNSPSDIRADFVFGFRTLAEDLPPATANYTSQGDGTLWISNGQRLFSGDTNLDADFTSNKITGTLFDNTRVGANVNGFEAIVTLTDGVIRDDGSISGNQSTEFTLIDATNPVVGSITNGNSGVAGGFYGAEAAEVGGVFNGEATVSQTGLGTNDFKYTGKFIATKQ